MDRTMLPDSLGDDHQKITKYNQLDNLGKTFCASTIHRDIMSIIQKEESRN